MRLQCPKCGSMDIGEEIDYIDDDKKHTIYYLNMCRQCKHLFDKKNS